MFAVFVFSWSLIEEQKREGLRHVTKNSQTTLVLLKVRSIPVLKLYIGRSVRPFIEKVNSNRDINLKRCNNWDLMRAIFCIKWSSNYEPRECIIHQTVSKHQTWKLILILRYILLYSENMPLFSETHWC
ncbi:hypothetical protein NPIL_452722 [Nephila pilipes]|uniref:Uncharacterized protein n=1 Tax=Nephila pilipes TaxID=299642 RepID=A0A8X6T9E8_NEPPI|nr:hypothetical protein NPIL_452722 [Nephila pilipes]